MMTKRRTVNTQVMMKLSSNASSAKPQSVTKADLEQTPHFDVWHSLLRQGRRSGCDDGISDVVGCEHGKSLKIEMVSSSIQFDEGIPQKDESSG